MRSTMAVSGRLRGYKCVAAAMMMTGIVLTVLVWDAREVSETVVGEIEDRVVLVSKNNNRNQKFISGTKERFCLSDGCVRAAAVRLARAFPDRSDRSWVFKPVKSDYEKRYDNRNYEDDDYDTEDSFGDDDKIFDRSPRQAVTTPAGSDLEQQEQHRFLQTLLRLNQQENAREVLFKQQQQQQQRQRRGGRNNEDRHHRLKSRVGGRWVGILYVKMAKAASSTCAGLALRIADRNGGLPVQYKHIPAGVARYGDRDANLSFLFTSVREPASRQISWNFFARSVGRSPHPGNITESTIVANMKSSDEKPQDMFKINGRGGRQISYTALDHSTIPLYSAYDPTINKTMVIDPDRVAFNVQQVIEGYDFVLLVERMEESLVAMAMVMGLDLTDVVLASSSKVGGSGYFMDQNLRCYRLMKPFYRSAVIDDYVRSDEWRAMNYGDYLLHAAANRSLDLTIQHTIGQDRFRRALKEYRKLKSAVDSACRDKVKMPCSKKGEPQPLSVQSCYDRDFGCGYPCADKVLENLTKKG